MNYSIVQLHFAKPLSRHFTISHLFLSTNPRMHCVEIAFRERRINCYFLWNLQKAMTVYWGTTRYSLMIRVYVSVFALKHGIHFCRPLDQITISWKKLNKDGLPVVLQNSRYVRKSDGRRLEIKEPTYEADNGIFQCVVEKGLNKQDTRNIELEVFSKSFHFSFLLFVHFRSVLHFYNLWFSDVFRGYKNRILSWNGLREVF